MVTVAKAASVENITPDVCVVGAGPVGITVARELAGRGVEVCLLEAGGEDLDPRIQRQSRAESDGLPLALGDSRLRGFGGTLRHPNVWDIGWMARPLDPIDFEPRAWVNESGWPFDRAHLDPYYTRAEAVCGIPSFDTALERLEGRLSSRAREFASDGVEPAVFQNPTSAFHDALAQLHSSRQVKLLLRTRVLDIRPDADGGHIDRVVAVREEGQRVDVRAQAVVLATGGIENARLLLTADGGRGLGNENDLVGRYFAERMTFRAGHVELKDPSTIDLFDRFHHVDELTGALRVPDELQRERQLLNCIFQLVPRPAAVTSTAARSLSNLRKRNTRQPPIPHVGRNIKNVLLGSADLARLGLGALGRGERTLIIGHQGEQAPNAESRVTLGSTVDDLGVPLAHVTWRMTDDDRARARESVRMLDEAFRAHSLGEAKWTADLTGTTLVEGNHHHLGTTRMHEDPRHGVVDPDSRVHSVDNLYVTGCSVFPTFGSSNPTLTIIALAIRLADHLAENLGAVSADGGTVTH